MKTLKKFDFGFDLTTLSELLKKGDVKQFKPSPSEVKALLELAERDLKRAEKDLSDKDLDWSLAVSYNAVLQAARAWMFFKGYRPAYGESHLAVIQFAIATLEESFGKEVRVLDNLRKKRHAAVYEKAGEVTEFEAKYALKTAKKFVEFIKRKTRV